MNPCSRVWFVPFFKRKIGAFYYNWFPAGKMISICWVAQKIDMMDSLKRSKDRYDLGWLHKVGGSHVQRGNNNVLRQNLSKMSRSMTAEEEVLFLRSELQRLAIHNDQLGQLVRQHDIKVSPTVRIICPGRTVVNAANRNIFLGGPVDAENWQKTVMDRLEGRPVVIFNPRREDWKTSKLTEQNAWEWEYVEKSNIAVFWFSWNHPNIESTLLELGRCTATK